MVFSEIKLMWSWEVCGNAWFIYAPFSPAGFANFLEFGNCTWFMSIHFLRAGDNSQETGPPADETGVGKSFVPEGRPSWQLITKNENIKSFLWNSFTGDYRWPKATGSRWNWPSSGTCVRISSTLFITINRSDNNLRVFRAFNLATTCWCTVAENARNLGSVHVIENCDWTF